MALKKPKMRKLPKKPKAGASSQSMETYLRKVKEVKKDNAKRLADYKREKNKREQLRRKIQSV